MGFDFSLPFFDHGALFVAGELHTVKVSETSVSLDLFAHKAKNDHSKLLKAVSGKKSLQLKQRRGKMRHIIMRIDVPI